MKNFFLDSLIIKNFKGIDDLSINFSNKTIICGKNATGKTSIYDAFMFLMFDKDSAGNSKFESRKLDANGEKVHHIDISVTANIRVDDVGYELNKTQVEKWTKKRGSETAELTGNQNKFSINGFPKSEKEFKEFINSIIDEKTFRLLTDPMAFLGLDWKEQRSMLMSFVDDIPREEIEKKVEGFSLIADDVASESIEACKKKYTATNSSLKKEQEKYLTLLEELPNMKVSIDAESIIRDRDALQSEIDIAEQTVRENPLPDVGDLNQKIATYEESKRTLSGSANADRLMKLASAKEEYFNLIRKKDNKEYEYKSAIGAEEGRKARIEALKGEYQTLADSFQKLKALKFDESSNVCKYCGQPLPADQADQNRKKFTDEIERQKTTINRQAASIKKQIKSLEESSVEIPDRSKIDDLDNQIKQRNAEIESLSNPVDVTGTDEYKSIDFEIAKVRQQIDALDFARKKRAELEVAIAEKRRQINFFSDQLTEVKANERIDKQIEETRASLRETSQKLADSEKYVFVLENYIRFIADKINERFSGLTFKLFETQLNGGIKDTCEITYNGVPYKSMNNGHKIIMGQQIIRTLQELFDISTPIWIDNAESVNDSNLLDMNCQMILLKVTDDKSLTIE